MPSCLPECGRRQTWGRTTRRSSTPFTGISLEQHEVQLYPFFLDGVAANPNLNLDDGMHPNADGVAEIVERIRPMVEAMIIDIAASSGT